MPLDGLTVDALRSLDRVLQVQPTRGRPGHYDLTPGGHIGVLRAGDVTLAIAPKLPLARVLFLLSYAMDGRWWNDDEVALPEDADLLEALVPFYARTVQRALRRGVLQGYRSREEALPLVRGRLRIEEQVRRRYGRMLPAEVRYDDYTVDTDANRLLLAAARRLHRLPLRSAASHVLLRRLEAAFEGVSHVPFAPRDLPAIAIDRLNAHYQPALELARRILQATSWDVGDGDVRATGCLIDMSQVFEDFVVRALRERLGWTDRVLRQGEALWLDVDHRVNVRPDLGAWHAGRPVFVGDLKYKRIADNSVRHPDVYQVLAYAVATDLPGALLIYAADEAEPARYRIVHADKTVEVVAVDLDGPIAAVRGDRGRELQVELAVALYARGKLLVAPGPLRRKLRPRRQHHRVLRMRLVPARDDLGQRGAGVLAVEERAAELRQRGHPTPQRALHAERGRRRFHARRLRRVHCVPWSPNCPFSKPIARTPSADTPPRP